MIRQMMKIILLRWLSNQFSTKTMQLEAAFMYPKD